MIIPLALLISGRWQVFFTATLGVLLFAGLSYLFFGPDTWTAFFNSTELSKQILHEGLVPYYKMQSLFAGAFYYIGPAFKDVFLLMDYSCNEGCNLQKNSHHMYTHM